MKLVQVFLLCLAVLLTACSPDATVQPDATDALEAAYTSVAITLTAQYTPEQPTATLQPTDTVQPTAEVAETAAPPTLPTTAQVPPPVVAATEIPCNNSVYVADVTIPDNTVMAPGEAFTKTWRIKNNGTCTWGEDFELVFLSGTDMGEDDVAVGQTIIPERTVDLSVALIAPATPGQYTAYFQLTDADGVAFGVSVYVIIDVSTDGTTTITATPTTTG